MKLKSCQTAWLLRHGSQPLAMQWPLWTGPEDAQSVHLLSLLSACEEQCSYKGSHTPRLLNKHALCHTARRATWAVSGRWPVDGKQGHGRVGQWQLGPLLLEVPLCWGVQVSPIRKQPSAERGPVNLLLYSVFIFVQFPQWLLFLQLRAWCLKGDDVTGE